MQISMNGLKLSRLTSKIAQEGATMNKVIELIIKGEDPIKVIEAAREAEDVIVPELQHLRGFAAGLSEHWVKQHKAQAVQELRWELGYILMELAYGEQPFQITPMERAQ